jgi:hypothetical protein
MMPRPVKSPVPTKQRDLPMKADRQRAYLDAMGIEVWRLRDTVAQVERTGPAIRLGPGGGGVLLLCSCAADASSLVATDIARALGAVPVWAWPQPEGGATTLGDAVDEHLFTTVAVFGERLADDFFGGRVPASLNSARLVLLPSIEAVREQAAARRVLWQTLCKNRMVSAN